jgi:predicted MPP superfamily phosphohydrolase
VTRGLQSIGYEVLANQHTVTRVRGAPLTILGIDDSASKHDDLPATFAGAPPRGSRLVMAHNPPTVDHFEPNAGLTCFSGHTHGGQVVVGHATDAIFRALGEPYLRGLYPVNGNALYVNRGLGWGRKTKVLHHGAEPEVALFVLRVGA